MPRCAAAESHLRPWQILEGHAPEGVVIVQFASIEAARAWHDSPAYQEVAQHRFKGARYRAVLVEDA